MDENRTILDAVAGIWLGCISLLIGYNTKRIGDIPEKYVQKEDFNIIRQELHKDFTRIHERLDMLIDQRKEVRKSE